MKPWIILTVGWLMAPGGFLYADELDPHMVAEGAKGIAFEKQLFSHLTSGNTPPLRDGLGRVYRFDQKFLEGNLRGYLDGYRKEVAKEKERDERTVLFYKTSLAYGIMAAGQYAEPSKEIVDVLTELAELFINQPTPPNVSSPSSQMVAIASMAFSPTFATGGEFCRFSGFYRPGRRMNTGSLPQNAAEGRPSLFTERS